MTSLVRWWRAGFEAIFWHRVEWILCSDPQTLVQEVETAISGTIAVIH